MEVNIVLHRLIGNGWSSTSNLTRIYVETRARLLLVAVRCWVKRLLALSMNHTPQPSPKHSHQLLRYNIWWTINPSYAHGVYPPWNGWLAVCWFLLQLLYTHCFGFWLITYHTVICYCRFFTVHNLGLNISRLILVQAYTEVTCFSVNIPTL